MINFTGKKFLEVRLDHCGVCGLAQYLEQIIISDKIKPGEG